MMCGRTNTRRRLRSGRKAGRRAAALLEMAIVLPLVLLFAFAATDYGRVVHAYLAVSNAARCGAEYGAYHGFTAATKADWEAQLRLVVVEEMQNLASFDAAELHVDVATSVDADDVVCTAVEVKYPFKSAIAWPGLPAASQLSHRAEMRRVQ